MEQDAEKITFVIALFDEMPWLRAAFVHLLQVGFQPHDMLLMAPANAFGGKLEDDWKKEAELDLSNITTWLHHPKSEPGTIPDSLFDLVHNHVLNFRDWLVPSFSKQLEDEMANGATALFVSVRNESQVAEGCQALLRYTNRDVQTHELSLR